MSRTFHLWREEIQEEEIKAKFENGILSVSIPKRKRRRLKVEAHFHRRVI
ncbi:MAG: Hsp20 family protein [Roseburia sp.]